MESNNREIKPFFNTELNIKTELDLKKLEKFLGCLAQIPSTLEHESLKPKIIYISTANDIGIGYHFMLVCVRHQVDTGRFKHLQQKDVVNRLLLDDKCQIKTK